jgi:predicted TIM-barrel fold metal-dependent hydrolase
MHNRRTFLGAAAGISLGAALSSHAPSVDAAELSPPIVDCHQHLWDLSRFRLPWIEKGSLLDRNYVAKDYMEAAKGLNVVQTVYMEVDVALDQKKAESDFLTDVCKEGKTVTKAAVVGGDLTSNRFPDYIAPYQGSAYIKGVRQVLHSWGSST